MLRGDSHGVLWLIIDEILSILALCDRATAERLKTQVILRLTAGAGVGCFVGLLMQSPNAGDLGISAALMRNFQAVVCASERSGFDHLGGWAEKFAPLATQSRDAIANLVDGFWAVCEGELFKPPSCLSATKKCSPVTSHHTAEKPHHTPSHPVTPRHTVTCDDV